MRSGPHNCCIGHSWGCLPSGLSRFLAQQVARSGRVPQHRVRVSNFDAMARVLKAGIGVALMPRSISTLRA
ncbi:LysR substrate-binding domain-containing protein [Methylibium sp.]|uniref:LysR substrate-binding domain-containing protein n=1 Tax=Methylibium sp. TaxID=2067992 RepID=UPI00345B5F40